MIFHSMWLIFTLYLSITTATNNAQLNALLQDYAYKALHRPRTGVIYDGAAPPNLAGVQVSAMRLRSGSLRKKGQSTFREFEIPKGVVENPYVERLVLVYHNLGNWSNTYYPLMNHTYLAPVLGLLAYDAFNLTEGNAQELHLRAYDQPIRIRFPELKPAPQGTIPKCVSFYSNGSVNFSNVSLNSSCATFEQGHFSIVFERIARPLPVKLGKARKENWRVEVVAACIVGGIVVLVVLGLLMAEISKFSYRRRMERMERAAEIGEALNMKNVGGTKAPAATGTRTHPKLETDYNIS